MLVATFQDVVRSFQEGRFQPRCGCCKKLLLGVNVRIDNENEVFLCEEGCVPAASRVSKSRSPKQRELVAAH